MADLHPHHAQALAAAWSLTDARQQLERAIVREDHQLWREARTVAAASDLQAWRPMIGRGGGGGHGDPTARTAVDVAEPTVRVGRLTRLATSTADTLRWLAGSVAGGGAGLDPLDRLRLAVPGVRPSTAEQVTRWLAEADARIRTALGVPPAEQLLPGVACPSCGVRQLYALTAGPLPTVVCRAGCRCAGDDCRCTMPIRPAGLEHIWPPGAELAERARAVLRR